jgi:CRISPR-associated endonuclease cas1, NMENI subtype
MSYRVLYIKDSEHLSLYLDNLKIETEKGDLKVPISDIQTLIIDNNKTTLTTRLMNALTNNNVCTILCGVDHLPQTYIFPINGHYAQSGNLLKQIDWSDEIKAKLHKAIVKGKITNQMKIMSKHYCTDTSYANLKKFLEEVEDGDPGNREGLAAKIYFRQMFGDGFIRFDSDVINAGLNYGYSIFRSLISSIIISKGYLPNIGLFHKGRENEFNLSDDLIEVFRPIVDDYVCTNMKDDILFTAEHREALIKLSTARVEFDHNTETISNAVTLYFESILKCIEKNSIDYYNYPDCNIRYDI